MIACPKCQSTNARIIIKSQDHEFIKYTVCNNCKFEWVFGKSVNRFGDEETLLK